MLMYTYMSEQTQTQEKFSLTEANRAAIDHTLAMIHEEREGFREEGWEPRQLILGITPSGVLVSVDEAQGAPEDERFYVRTNQLSAPEDTLWERFGTDEVTQLRDGRQRFLSEAGLIQIPSTEDQKARKRPKFAGEPIIPLRTLIKDHPHDMESVEINDMELQANNTAAGFRSFLDSGPTTHLGPDGKPVTEGVLRSMQFVNTKLAEVANPDGQGVYYRVESVFANPTTHQPELWIWFVMPETGEGYVAPAAQYNHDGTVDGYRPMTPEDYTYLRKHTLREMRHRNQKA